MNQPGLVLPSPSSLSHPYVHSVCASFFLALHSSPLFRHLAASHRHHSSSRFLSCSAQFSRLFPSIFSQMLFSLVFFFYLSAFHHPGSCRLLSPSSLSLIPTFSISPSSHILSFVIVAQSSFVHACFKIFQIFIFHTHLSLTFPGVYPQFSCSDSVTHISVTVLCVSPTLSPYTHTSHPFSPSISLGKGLLKCSAG